MKLIDLFSRMVTNKELPEKIKFKNKIWTLDYPCFTYRDENDECIEKRFILENLTEEVEIIEEHKIPKKLDIELNIDDENKVNYYRATNLECDLAFKINEILDYLSKEE